MKIIKTFSHYLLPGYSNDHKAKAIHTSSFLTLALFLVTVQLVIQTLPLTGIKILGYAANISTDRVISLVNQKRTEAGLSSLTFDAALTNAAKAKAQHMIDRDYWSHIAPDGTEPWFFFTNAGYKYKYAGENLARDFSNAESAVDAWMASTSHRDNILSAKYSETGVAVIEGDLSGVDTTIIVQLFGTKLNQTSDVPVAKAQTQATPTPAITKVPTPTNTGELTATETISVDESIVPTQTTEGEIGVSQENQVSDFKILVSPFETTKGISQFVILILLLILLIDIIIVIRRRIPRIGGRTWAHLLFFVTILAIILISKAGNVI